MKILAVFGFDHPKVLGFAIFTAVWLLSRVAAAGEAAIPPTLLPPEALAKNALPSEAHPLAPAINAFIERQTAERDFKPTGLTRADYLRAIEGQVKVMRGWQNDEGRIIDPVRKSEWYYTTP